MGNVLNHSILVLESVVHLLRHIGMIFLEFTEGVGLNLLNSLALGREFRIKLLSELCLTLLTTLLLGGDGIFYNRSLILEQFQDFPLFLNSS